MRVRKIVFVLMLLSVSLSSNIEVQGVILISSNSIGPNGTEFDPYDLELHDPIIIENTTDFISQASSEGWSGTGDYYDPYVISNLNITSYSPWGIKIADVNVSYVLENNWILGTTESAISINSNSNHQYIRIQGNRIQGNNVGINSTAEDAEIINNIIDYNNIGILVNEVSNQTIYDNVIESHIEFGIQLINSSYIYIGENLVKGASVGLYIESENIITNLYVDYNYFLQCDLSGIIQTNGSQNTFHHNIFDDTSHSIWFQGRVSANNTIFENIFWSSLSQDDTIGPSENIWYRNLYWDYVGPGFYTINGSRGSLDNDPLPLDHDFDNDNVIDLQELVDGTNPFDPNDFIALPSTTIQTSSSFDQPISQETSSELVSASSSPGFLIIFMILLGISLIFVLYYLGFDRINQFLSKKWSSINLTLFGRTLIGKQKSKNTLKPQGPMCGACGALVSIDDKFCMECGTGLNI